MRQSDRRDCDCCCCRCCIVQPRPDLGVCVVSDGCACGLDRAAALAGCAVCGVVCLALAEVDGWRADLSLRCSGLVVRAVTGVPCRRWWSLCCAALPCGGCVSTWRRCWWQQRLPRRPNVCLARPGFRSEAATLAKTSSVREGRIACLDSTRQTNDDDSGAERESLECRCVCEWSWRDGSPGAAKCGWLGRRWVAVRFRSTASATATPVAALCDTFVAERRSTLLARTWTQRQSHARNAREKPDHEGKKRKP